MMKKLVMGLGLAALLASPALAQSYDPDMGSGNINPPVASLLGAQTPAASTPSSAYGAYAYEPEGRYQQPAAPIAPRRPHRAPRD